MKPAKLTDTGEDVTVIGPANPALSWALGHSTACRRRGKALSGKKTEPQRPGGARRAPRSPSGTLQWQHTGESGVCVFGALAGRSEPSECLLTGSDSDCPFSSLSLSFPHLCTGLIISCSTHRVSWGE